MDGAYQSHHPCPLLVTPAYLEQSSNGVVLPGIPIIQLIRAGARLAEAGPSCSNPRS